MRWLITIHKQGSQRVERKDLDPNKVTMSIQKECISNNDNFSPPWNFIGFQDSYSTNNLTKVQKSKEERSAWRRDKKLTLTVSQMWSLMVLLPTLMVRVSNSIPRVILCTSWNIFSVTCRARHDFPTPVTNRSISIKNQSTLVGVIA